MLSAGGSLLRTVGMRALLGRHAGAMGRTEALWLDSRRGMSSGMGGGVDDEEADSDPDFQPQVKKVVLQEDSIQKEIGKIVKENPVVLFMKGLPSAPQCGFSMKTVQVLNAVGAEYRAFNVLSSSELRDGVKKFSKWPTIPQLYVKGDFVGGCDIVEGLHKSGELKNMLSSATSEAKAQSGES